VVDVDAAVAFYRAAFAAELITRHTGAYESIAIHATIKIGNSIVALNQQLSMQARVAPLDPGQSAAQIHLYVDDVDLDWNRAVEAGALVQTPLFDSYWGDRMGVLSDPDGHLWSLASKIENVSQDEIARRGKGSAETLAAVEALMTEDPVAADAVAI